jgi:DNA-binding transcriptional regulator YiaG
MSATRNLSISGWHNPGMPNIASVLKSEISRVAKREIRAELQALKKSSARHRADIAAMKRSIDSLERQLRQTTKKRGAASRAETDTESEPKRRFSAKRLTAHRAKLGLSAENYGRLCGVSGQTIYKWEQERARPQAAQLQALGAIRGIGIREALARLDQLAD